MKLYLLSSLFLAIGSSIRAQSETSIGSTQPSITSPSPNAAPSSNNGQSSVNAVTSSAFYTILTTLPAPVSTTPSPMIPVPAVGVDSIQAVTSPSSYSPYSPAVTILSTISTVPTPNPQVPIVTPIVSSVNDGGTTSTLFDATTILATILTSLTPPSQTVSNVIPTVSSQSNPVILSTNIVATSNQAVTTTGAFSTGVVSTGAVSTESLSIGSLSVGDSSTGSSSIGGSFTTGSSYIGPSPTVTYGNNGVPTVSPAVQIQLPVLKQCSYATFNFVGPSLPKHLGIFTKGSPHFFETYNLPDSYNSMTNGSFTWTVDLPVGLSVGMMFYVLIDNIIPKGGSATTPYGIVQPGTSSTCIAQNNDLVDTSVILSYASSLDPQFKYAGPTLPAGGGGVVIAEPIHPNPVAEIVGGVIGGLALFALIATAFYFTYKNRQERTQLDDDSTFGGTGSEKHGSFYQQSQQTTPPPFGTAGNMYYDQTNPNEVDGYGRPLSDASRYSDYRTTQTAQPGTLPEPMDADEFVEDHGPYSPTFSSAPVSPNSSPGFYQTSAPSSSRPFEYQGLANPNSFSHGLERGDDRYMESGRQAPLMVDEE